MTDTASKWTDPRRDRPRRRSLRLLVASRSGDVIGLVKVLDLSATGMLVESDPPLEPGQAITFDLPQVGPQGATVIWASNASAGCSFDTPLPEGAVSAALLMGPATREERQGSPGAVFQPSADFPQRLRQERLARGMSLDHLAAQLGLSKQTVWYWEKGRNLPSAQHLLRLNQVLGAWTTGDQPAAVQAPAPARPSSLGDLIERTKQQLAREIGVDPEAIEISVRL